MLIDYDAPTDTLPYPLDNGGQHAFFTTVRPRHWDPAYIDRSYEKVSSSPYFLIVQEDLNHLHIVEFLHRPVTRSNYITNWLNKPLKEYDESERKLFRKYDRDTASGAVITVKDLNLISGYLSGDYASKSERPFSILAARLPKDLSHLEEFLPSINGLKGKRSVSIWYKGREAIFKEEHPDHKYVSECDLLVWYNRHMNIIRDFEVIADPRILKQKIRALKNFINKSDTPFYSDGPYHVFSDTFVTGQIESQQHN